MRIWNFLEFTFELKPILKSKVFKIKPHFLYLSLKQD